MKIADKYKESDVIHEYKTGLNKTIIKQQWLRIVTIKFDLSTKKGKAIGQLLDGIRRLL